jgi:hypothetical protein
MHYYGRCVTEDPQGTWADSRYSAGGALVNVFASLWRDARVPREVTTELKEGLADLYIHGDENVRTALVTACFEHLFEQKDIRDLFSDWKKDAILSIAYEKACEWYRGGGETPLGKPTSGLWKRPGK